MSHDDLFPDEPLPKPRTVLELTATLGVNLSATQRAFKRLVDDIEAAETRIKQSLMLADVHRPLYDQKLRPLQDELDRLNRAMVLLLDQKLLGKGFGVRQRDTMSDLLYVLAEQLLDSAFQDEMAALLDRHDGLDDGDDAPSAEEAEEAEALKAQIEAMFGIDFGDEATDAQSAEDKLAEAMRIIDERAKHTKAEHEAAASAHAAHKRRTKKTAKQIKALQQEVDAGKLLKDIYRKLASALHPDREPDENERLRKTALMKDVNKAYKSQNLLALLQLQIEANKLDAVNFNAAAMADHKLAIINVQLKQQLQDLMMESQQLEMRLRDEFRLEYFQALNAEILQKRLRARVAAGERSIKHLSQELVDIQRSSAAFKAWLKDQQ